MTSILVENVHVSFPIYDGASRSLRSRIVAGRLGGHIGSDRERRVSVDALSDISFALQHGDRVALVGHNGAGKTTLLRVLAGIYAPVRGRVSTEGRIAPLFDVALGIDPDSTGYENIRLRGLYLGLTRGEIDARMDEVAAFSELGPFLNMPVRTYSAGMLTRLAFAVSTSIEPDILLLDEGIAAGDAAFMEKANKRLHAFIERAGIMVLASHSEPLVRMFCNKAVLLEHGRLLRFGTIDEVLAAYAGGEQVGKEETGASAPGPAPAAVEVPQAVEAQPAETAALALLKSENPPAQSGPGSADARSDRDGAHQQPPEEPAEALSSEEIAAARLSLVGDFQLALQSGEYGVAADRARALAALPAYRSEGSQLLAQALVLAGDAEGAVAAATEATRAEPDSVEAKVVLADALLRANGVATGIAVLRDVLAFDPGHAHALRLLSAALAVSDDLEGAVRAARVSVAMDGANADYQLNLGHLLMATGRTGEAAPVLERALALNPGSEYARTLLERAAA